MTMASRRLIPVLLFMFVNMSAICRSDEPDNDAQKTSTSHERDFTLNVLPVLKAKCLGCHGDDTSDLKGDLDMRTRAGLLKGGESGEPSLVVGKPDASPLFKAINWEELEMPPKENDRLNAEQIELVRRWIKNGAPWPDESAQQKYRIEARATRETAEGLIVDTSGGTSDEWTYRRYQKDDLWAFRPIPSKDQLFDPEKTNTNPIDHFIGMQLTANGFKAARQATPETLIRRATFDLLGLPPTPEEIDSFRAAWQQDSATAWSELIDRLLANPHYGERWAQHWLDVTRYADTGGMSNDYERSNLWRYRDYVIRAFNSDKPYNEFVIEQLAGDELADASVRRRANGNEAKVLAAQLNGDYTPEEAEWIVATGFLRLGPWDNAMVEASEARQIFLDDIVNVTGQTFLSTTLRCVKCHDHKFDPIPTRDYYRIYAAFSATQMAERPVPFLSVENRDTFEQGKKHVEMMLAFATEEKNKLVAKREAAAKAWFEGRGLEYKNEQERKELPDEEKPPRHVGLDYIDEGQLKVREQDEWIWNRRLERFQPMAQSVYNASSAALAWNGARKLRIDKKADRKSAPVNHILIGGALSALGERVGPGVLSVAGLSVGAKEKDPYVLPSDINGRRLGLARWIADPKNPLTARSIVNRVWQYHFGRGIAGNPNNFGAKGAKPTHPKLLDFLAADFVDHGWKLKRLHRMIMSSQTYQRASRHSNASKLADQDPNNHLLTYFPQRRLTSEEIRDSMLFVTGELSSVAGGLPIMPEINMEVALQPRMIQFSIAPAYQPSPTPELRNRRTIYAYRIRGQADPFLEIFNQPNPNESCELRDSAAVTPQAFTLLNSDMVTDRSIAMALRLEKETTKPTQQIDIAFRHILGRAATATELDRLNRYVTEMTDYHVRTPVRAVAYPKEITRSLVEEFSGKSFQYREILPIFESYQPDPKPGDVSARTRALADMCLILFNSNEFMFLR